MRRTIWISAVAVPLVALAFLPGAWRPGAAENATTPNRANEPLATEFSLARAVSFSDRATTAWEKRRGCVTCHTNGLYLLARSRLTPQAPEVTSARNFARDYLRGYVLEGKEPRGQHGSVEGLVATTCFLAMADVAATGSLDTVTQRSLDHLWSLQDESGAWESWLKCHWGPFEVDDHFGASLVALTLGRVPVSYRKTPVAKDGLERLTSYLTKNPPTTAHQKGMMLWAGKYLPRLTPRAARRRWVKELLALQHEDGGWALIELGDESWKREDGKPQERTSDGYATAFMLFTLIQAGIEPSELRLLKAQKWLRANQRQSGRWFTRSPRRDRHHYITHAATNMAILALAECGDSLPDSPTGRR